MVSVNAAIVGYSAAAAAFLVLTVLLVTLWRRRELSRPLAFATSASAVWALLIAWGGYKQGLSYAVVVIAEAVRAGSWFFFLLRPFPKNPDIGFSRRIVGAIFGFCVLVVVLAVAGGFTKPFQPGVEDASRLLILSGFSFAVIGFVLVEQLYRNMRSEFRWAVKFLCFGVGAMFAFDLYLYSQGLLFNALNPAVLVARGFVHALMVPLIGITAARKPHWSRSFVVSRRIVFYTASVFAVGVYLMAMAVGGYYVRIFGGTWGAALQLIFLFGALVVLVVALFSGQVRAKFRVYLSKYFLSYHYDYRKEWLRLTDTLSDPQSELTLGQRAIAAVAKVMNSRGGHLWVSREDARFVPLASYPGVPVEKTLAADSSLATFLYEHEWILDLGEMEENGERYKDVELPEWITGNEDAWLVVPLLLPDKLLGFMLLDKPHAARRLTWEDIDLLRAVGKQVATVLAQDIDAQSLSETRQFDAYNRLTTFIMHDLKNLIAQQSLVVQNAAKHKDDPAFVEDAIATIDNSVKRMNRLLVELKRGDASSTAKRTELGQLLERVVARSARRSPPPKLEPNGESMPVLAREEKLATVIEHLIRNAQEATSAEGEVVVRLNRNDDDAVIDIEDNGEGMDEAFVRERLFQPFHTTKGSKGMGIGVYQAREVIRRSGGELIVRSKRGEGTCMRIVLPLLDRNHENRPTSAGGETLEP